MSEPVFLGPQNNRYQLLNHGPKTMGPVLYWMNRDQRVEDNWALFEALKRAEAMNQPVIVIFALLPGYGSSTTTHFDYMKKGLKRVVDELGKRGIGWILRQGDPVAVVPHLVHEFKASVLITDFNPLKKPLEWRFSIAHSISVDMVEVDAHNIVPCLVASPYQEYGAYTLRPKIHKLLSQYLVEYPQYPQSIPLSSEIINKIMLYDQTSNVLSGVTALSDPLESLTEFIEHRLALYELRNDPTLDATSRLSTFLHFGQLSAQRVAIQVQKSGYPSEAFLEELIVRRELADNFCYHNPQYDSLAGFPEWAQKTLHAHRHDERPFLYSLSQLKHGETHDRAWNAAQMEMVKTGRMHGYMRMYWAKKILEWTPSPEVALEYAIYLNDHYEMDGRDPNGYTGIAWAIGGVHDRPWKERPIFGMIRYMNEAGLRRKFDLDTYIERIEKMK